MYLICGPISCLYIWFWKFVLWFYFERFGQSYVVICCNWKKSCWMYEFLTEKKKKRKKKNVVCFHKTSYHLLLLNSVNVGLTTIVFVLFNTFPQFLQNQGFLASISTENEIQVLILLRLFKFFSEQFFSLNRKYLRLYYFHSFLLILILVSFFLFIFPLFATNMYHRFNRLLMLAGLGFGTQANSFNFTVGVQYNCFLCHLWHHFHVWYFFKGLLECISITLILVCVWKWNLDLWNIVTLSFCTGI